MKKKWIITTTLIVLALLATFAYRFVPSNLLAIERWVMSVPSAAQTSDEQRSLATLETINDHPFYRMTYYGDYPRYLQMKRRFYWALGLPKPLCSSFAALNPQGHTILGYNNDGDYHAILLLHTNPPDGYASISISDIGAATPGFSKTFTPYSSDSARSLLLYAPYMTQTGMNEMGLAVSTMYDPSADSRIDPKKDTLAIAEARRYVLDHAKDVEQAIGLLTERNVSFAGAGGTHLLLADRSGHSALLEWVGGNMIVIRNQQAWQVSTNFQVYGSDARITADLASYRAKEPIDGDSLGNSRWRYAAAWETLRQTDGLLTPQQGIELLSTVSVPYRTNYSIVYDLTTGDVQVVTERDYSHIYRDQLPIEE